jgi:hypothetical protein
MSTSIAAQGSPTKSIHLLRALLREASYLPDAVSRQYFHRYILGRFRAYQPKQNATTTAASDAVDRHHRSGFKRHELGVITARTGQMQKAARKGLNYLQRANQGELPCLERVLYLAYGRIGRRKHALLEHVLRPDPVMDGGKVLSPADCEGSSPLQELYHSNKQWLQYFDAPKSGPEGMYIINISSRYSRFRAALKSQYQKGISINRELKGPAMKTPKYNVWMRPMPIKRAVNNVRRWYAEAMTRFLPPLPIEEWDHVDAMIKGTQKINLVKRRKPARLLYEESFAEAESPVEIVLEGLRMEKLSKAVRPQGSFRPHEITPRFMRRLYHRLLQLCCKVEYSEERKYWVPTWGQSTHPIQPSVYNAPTDDALFAGVDAKGQKIRLGRKPKPQADPDLQPRNSKGEYVRFPFYTEFLPGNHPLRKDLEAWKKKRKAAGIIDEDGTFVAHDDR